MAAHSDGLGAPPPDGEDPMPKAITSKKTSSASPAVHDEEAATAKVRLPSRNSVHGARPLTLPSNVEPRRLTVSRLWQMAKRMQLKQR